MNLSYDILKKVFSIEIKVKGYLKNITDNTIENFSAISKLHNSEYVYHDYDTTYTLKDNLPQEIILKRENNEIIHVMIFNKNKITSSEYFLKEYHHSLNFNIKTSEIAVKNNKIKILYQILETENKYEYLIEMSDKK